mgnify:CR=1 FL=1|tara:strand:- start:942 stop:1085 length:144 start_codon:yes stop_codon:yes gene_type:complete
MNKEQKEKKFMAAVSSGKNNHSARARRRKMQRALDKHYKLNDDNESV